MNCFLLIGASSFALCSMGLISALRCSAGWRAWVCYQIARAHSILFTRWQAENPCTFPEDSAALIVANHTSPVDPVVLWIRHFSGFRRKRLRVIGFLMAREYFDQGGIVGWVCRAMEAIPVGRSGRDMGPVQVALRRLQSGQLLGIFPEGRLNLTAPDTQLLPGGTGVAWLALKSEVPVLPVFIRDSPRGKTMAGCFLTFSRTRVIYGPPIDLTPWHGQRISHTVLVEVTNLIMQRLAELGEIGWTPLEASRWTESRSVP